MSQKYVPRCMMKDNNTSHSSSHGSSSYGSKSNIVKPILSDNDFPSLAPTKKVTPSSSSRPTYAELSRNWAIKQREETLLAKQAADKAQEEEQIRKESEALRLSSMKSLKALRTKYNAKHDSDEDKEIDIGCHTIKYVLEEYNYDATSDSDEHNEEEQEYEMDTSLDYRRNKNEMY